MKIFTRCDVEPGKFVEMRVTINGRIARIGGCDATLFRTPFQPDLDDREDDIVTVATERTTGDWEVGVDVY